MTLETEVIAIHTIQPGESVGYGATFTCERTTKVGTVAIGYGDGYHAMQVAAHRFSLMVSVLIS